jgi:hypothetical protein
MQPGEQEEHMVKTVDIVVLGGGLAGCAVARSAAAQGLKAAIVERRASLGHELTATGRAWIRNGTSESLLPLPGGSLKKRLLQELLDDGNVPLFCAAPAAVAMREDVAAGVVIGNKYGLQWLPARAVIDTTPGGAFAGLLGHARKSGGETVEVAYVLEMEGVGYYYEPVQRVPASFGFLRDEAILRDGLRNRTLLAEFAFTMTLPPGIRNGKAVAASEAKRRAGELAEWLRGNVEAFADARLIHLPPEALIRSREPEETEAGEPAWPGLLIPQNGMTEENGSEGRSKQSAYAGLYALPVSIGRELSTRDLERLSERADRMIETVFRELPEAQPEPTEYRFGESTIAAADCLSSPFEDRGMDVALTRLSIDGAAIFDRMTAPALVAGLGTSGMMAARALIEQGEKPVMLESNSEPGGTSVVGQVHGYWNGYRDGINAVRDKQVKEIARRISGKGNATDGVAAILYQQELLREHAERCFTGTLLCGTLTKGNRVTGALAVDELGLFAIDAEVTIDATGDADVAYLAGCEYEFGDPRDGVTQSSSQWGEEHWDIRTFKDSRYLSDIDVIYQDRYSELLRGIALAHRNNSDYRFSDMLTVRESRRIKGEYVLTMKDIYTGSAPDDCVGVTLTPFDNHGIGSGYFAQMGLNAVHEKNKARIPYRAYIPKRREGLLVTGKSFSATRDAACICRMNADLRHAGYTVGLAAAMACGNGVGVREIDVAALQSRLRELGILPEWALAKSTEDDADAPNIAGGRYDFLRLLSGPKETALRRGREAVRSADEKTRSGGFTVLAWHEEPDALDAVAARLESAIRAGGLAASPLSEDAEEKELAHTINRNIALLGKAARRADANTIRLALERSSAGGSVQYLPTAYHRSRIDGWRVPHYMRLMTLAQACERLADPALLPGLERLLEERELSGYISDTKHGAVKPFFCSYLELSLARASARCAGRAGMERLIGYLGDVRYVLGDIARRELTDMTGCDFGFDRERWRGWLREQSMLTAVPYEGPVTGYTEVH